MQFKDIPFPMSNSINSNTNHKNTEIQVIGDVFVHLCSEIPKQKLPEPCAHIEEKAIGFFVYPESDKEGAKKLCFPISNETPMSVFTLIMSSFKLLSLTLNQYKQSWILSCSNLEIKAYVSIFTGFLKR